MTGRKLKGMVLKVKMVRGPKRGKQRLGWVFLLKGQRGDVPKHVTFPKKHKKKASFSLISAGTRSIFLCKGGTMLVFYDFFEGILEDGDGVF